VENLSVRYASPSQGALEMAWDGAGTQDGVPVAVEDFPRYENPYTATTFPGDVISFEHAGQSLTLDFKSQSRSASCFQE
jgi:hypothetical protein